MTYTIKETDKTKSSFFDRLKNPALLMEKISLFAQSEIQKNIERGVKPENSSLTKTVKRGDKTLRDTGNLLASIHSRHSAKEAAVSSNHIAALVNHPDDGRTETVIKPKRAKYLTIPASPQTRTFQRRYGFSPKEVLDGLRRDGYAVYRPYVSGGARRANIILAQKKTKRGKTAVKVFILCKSVTQPVRRFMYLDETALKRIDEMAGDYYAGA